MPDPLYTRLLATANRIIRQKGKPAQIIRSVKSGPAHNPTIDEVTHSIYFVETGYSLTNRNDTLIKQGDVVGLVSMDGDVGVLLFTDIIVPDVDTGARYNMVDLMPLNPGGVQLLTELVAR